VFGVATPVKEFRNGLGDTSPTTVFTRRSMAGPSIPTNADAATTDGIGYAPYGQLVKMLLPSAGSIVIYDAAGEVAWCSDGSARPDLRALLDRLKSAGAETLAGRGGVEPTAGGASAFVSALRGPDGRPLGALVLELRSSDQSPRQTASFLAGLLRP